MLDVGSYQGSFAAQLLRFPQLPNPTIVCFDGAEENVATVREKFGKRGVIAEHYAVGSVCGTATFSIPVHSFQGANSWGGRILDDSNRADVPEGERKVTVPAITLEKYLLKHQRARTPGLVKIDVQGGEMEVVRGLGGMVAEVPLLYLECQLKHGQHIPWIPELESLGFEVVADTFQFGFFEELPREEIEEICVEMGIRLLKFHSSKIVYGVTLAGGDFLRRLETGDELGERLEYFQTDLLCLNRRKNLEFSAKDPMFCGR